MLGNFQIRKIYVEATIHQLGEFAPRKIIPLHGTQIRNYVVQKYTLELPFVG